MNQELSHLAASPDWGKSHAGVLLVWIATEPSEKGRWIPLFWFNELLTCHVGTSFQHLALGWPYTFTEFTYISPQQLLRMSDCLLSSTLQGVSILKTFADTHSSICLKWSLQYRKVHFFYSLYVGPNWFYFMRRSLFSLQDKLVEIYW